MLLRVLRQVALRTTISTSTVAQGPGMPPPGCRILVINRGGGSRRVSNHGSMLTGIMDQHPECELAVHSGKEPLKSQLELFRKATTIVAPHGAGLSNIYISRPGTGVLEFLVMNGVGLCYMIAAAKLGLRYWSSPQHLFSNFRSKLRPQIINTRSRSRMPPSRRRALAFPGSSQNGAMTANIREVK
mmetsp:Transcript_41637/g.94938  ORF Transcript_41637/g.94938 Transcript_41637/m.94938 type:complete len:186 (-) Transcript_41637:1232-1789(-)